MPPSTVISKSSKKLVARKAYIDRQPHNAGLFTPLMRAVKQKQGLVAVFLLQSGASPYRQTKWNQNASDIAAETGDANIIRLLNEFRH